MQSTASMYPSQYRKYYRDWKDAYAEKPEIFHDSGFEWLAKHAKRVGGSHKVVDGKIMRVFFPIYIEPTVPQNMRDMFESNNYQVVSDSAVLDNHNRQVSINKAFQQLAKKSGLDANDVKKNLDLYAEELGASGAMILVVSRHPYDIAGMSTGRAWKSCHTVGGMSPRDKKKDAIARRKFYEKNEALRKAAEAEAAESDDYVEAKKNLALAESARNAVVSAVQDSRKEVLSWLNSPEFSAVLQKNMESIRRAARMKQTRVIEASLAFIAASVRKSMPQSAEDGLPEWVRLDAAGKAARVGMAVDFLSSDEVDDDDDDLFSALNSVIESVSYSEDVGDAIAWLYVLAMASKLYDVQAFSRGDFPLPENEPRVSISPSLISLCTAEDNHRLYSRIKAAAYDNISLWNAISRVLALRTSDLEHEIDAALDPIREISKTSLAAERAFYDAEDQLILAAELNPAQHTWDEVKDKEYTVSYRDGLYSRLVRQDVITGSVIAYVIKPKMSLLTSLERAGKLLPKYAEALESRLDKGNKDPIFEPLGRVVFRTASSRGDDSKSRIPYLRAGKVYGFSGKDGKTRKYEVMVQFRQMAKRLVAALNKASRRDMHADGDVPQVLYRGEYDETYPEGDRSASPRLNHNAAD